MAVLSLLHRPGFLGSLAAIHTEPTRHCPAWSKSRFWFRQTEWETLSSRMTQACLLQRSAASSVLPTSLSCATHLHPGVGQQPEKIKGGKVYTFFPIHHDVVGWRPEEREREWFTSAPIRAPDSRHSTAMQSSLPICSPPLSFILFDKSENDKLKIKHLPIKPI